MYDQDYKQDVGVVSFCYPRQGDTRGSRQGDEIRPAR